MSTLLESRWNETKEALLEGLQGSRRSSMAVVLENTRKHLAENATGGGTQAGNIATLNRVILPVIRRVMPTVIANEIVGVQPMTGPVAQIHTLRVRYADNMADGSGYGTSTTSGDEALSPFKIAVAYSGSAATGRADATAALEGKPEGEQAIANLLEAVDTEIPMPERETDKPFLMSVEDVFSITGRGTVATGRIDRGIVKVNETVEIVGLKDTVTTVVTGIEMFRKLLDEGRAGDNVGILLRGIDKEGIQRGQVIAAPKSILPHRKAKAEIYVLSKDEGGRHTPFFNGYRPQFYFRTTDVTGVITLPKGVEMIMPGDNINVDIELINPIAMEKTQRFAIREGGRTIGAGRITEITE